jgi:tetracycline 7-halogenase / FADH2 O2-dependent halogenase
MTERYDVAILGAGFEGSLLGTILAYKGAKVLMLDAGTHPRFALGESTVRHTFRMLKIMAERFGVPELKDKFYSAQHLHKHVSGAFGIKKNFGFILHRKGEHQTPEEATQFVIPPYREGHEAHLFRQDTDAFLTYTAIHHGATVKYSTKVKEVEVSKEYVSIRSEKNETFHASFVADASGGGHVLSRMWNLRDNPPRVKLESRCLFTHMIDVKPYDDLHLPYGVPKAPQRWYEGTCHHLFDGGWVWVIPFNNRPGSTNPVISVGVSFDMRKFPKPTDITPHEEWRQFLDQYPSIKEQFKDAKPVRDWVSTDRLQTSCRQTVGDRWALMAGGAGSGFFDALFSRGLAGSMEVTHALAARILKALKEDDFSAGQFEYVARLHENLLQNNDKLVRSAYTSFRDFDLWNAWFRVWVLGVGLGDLKLASTYRRYLRTRDDSLLPDAEEPMGLFFSQHKGFQALFDSAVAKMDEVEEGRTDTKAAANYIFDLIRSANFTPAAHNLGDPECHVINSGRRIIELKTLVWLFTSAPPDIRDLSLGLLGLGRAQPAAQYGNRY